MERLTGKQFEQIIVDINRIYRQHMIAECGRYGVQAARMADGYQVMRSLPDFEGIVHGGRQFIFDCKVVSGASLILSEYRKIDKQSKGDKGKQGKRHRQYRHMMNRSDMGAMCGFLIHWNARELKTKSEPADTFWIPVHRESELWDRFETGEIGVLTRMDCAEFGVRIEWLNEFGKKPRPYYLTAILSSCVNND